MVSLCPQLSNGEAVLMPAATLADSRTPSQSSVLAGSLFVPDVPWCFARTTMPCVCDNHRKCAEVTDVR
jgi:hypothetical protein